MNTKNASLLKMLIGNGNRKSDFTDIMHSIIENKNNMNTNFVDNIFDSSKNNHLRTETQKKTVEETVKKKDKVLETDNTESKNSKTEEEKSEIEKINEIVKLLNDLDSDKIQLDINMMELTEENAKDITDMYNLDDDIIEKELQMAMPSDLNDEDSEAADDYDKYFRESSGKRDDD